MLHKPAIDQIKNFSPSSDELLELFQRMVDNAVENNQDELSIFTQFYSELDAFENGTYVPEIHLVIRKVVVNDTPV